jgi:phosphatidylglycerophosphate synthase
MNFKKLDEIITKGTGLIDHYIFRNIIKKLFKFFNFKKIHPNFIVLLNIFLVIISFFLIISKNYLFGILGLTIYFFYDLFDLLDGAIARYYNKTSKFGALFDSLSDFFSELLILFGMGIYFSKFYTFFYLIFFILLVVFFNDKIKCNYNIKERQINFLKLSKKTIFEKIKFILVILTRNDLRKAIILFGFILENFYIIIIYFAFLYFLVLLNDIVFLIRNYRK